MAIRNHNAPKGAPSRTDKILATAPGVTLLTFPPAQKVQILKAIAGATGLSATQAKEHIEKLPVTLRALLSDSALAEELEGLGATIYYPPPPAQPAASTPSAELPTVLSRYLAEQQRNALNLQDMLERLAADYELPACLGIAARAAHDLNEALDANSIRHVLEGRTQVPWWRMPDDADKLRADLHELVESMSESERATALEEVRRLREGSPS